MALIAAARLGVPAGGRYARWLVVLMVLADAINLFRPDSLLTLIP